MKIKRIVKILLVVLAAAVTGVTLFLVGGIYVIGKVHKPMYQKPSEALQADTSELNNETHTVDSFSKDLFNLESYLVNTIADSSRVSVIDETCAVLIYPTEEQINAMKTEYGEEDFYTVAEYQAQAILMLDSLHIHTVTLRKPLIKFVGKQNEWTLNPREKGLPEWNIIFFNTSKKPEIVSAIDLNIEQI